MRRRDREIKDEKEILRILEEGFVCHLAMCRENKPYVIPMIYAYGDHCLFFHCAEVGLKLDILRENNQVCFEVQRSSHEIIENGGTPCDWGFAYESVIGFGEAELIEDEDEKIAVYDRLVKKIKPTGYTHEKIAAHEAAKGDEKYGAYVPKKIRGTYIIKVKIDSMTGKKWNGHK